MSRQSVSESWFENPLFFGMVVLLLAAGILYLLRQVFFVFFIVFAGILLSIFLTVLAGFVRRLTHLSRDWSLALTIILLLVVFGASGWLAGSAVVTQLTQLIERLPQAVDVLQSYLSDYQWGRNLLSISPSPQELLPMGKGILGNITGFFTTAAGVFTGLFVVLFMGIYISIEPDLYLNGFLRLFPSERRSRIRDVLKAVARALRWWLIGRAGSMIAVGLLSMVGLLIIGLPLAPALGIIAGLLTFVPFVGPVLSAIPAVFVALVEGPYMVLYVVIVYTVVQQLENHLITPLIQKRAVFIPPVVLLTGQLLIGVLFGFIGFFLATPLVIVFVVLIQTLYVEDVLGESIKILGAHITDVDKNNS